MISLICIIPSNPVLHQQFVSTQSTTVRYTYTPSFRYALHQYFVIANGGSSTKQENGDQYTKESRDEGTLRLNHAKTQRLLFCWIHAADRMISFGLAMLTDRRSVVCTPSLFSGNDVLMEAEKNKPQDSRCQSACQSTQPWVCKV